MKVKYLKKPDFTTLRKKVHAAAMSNYGELQEEKTKR
jgi:hypothetical protein